MAGVAPARGAEPGAVVQQLYVELVLNGAETGAVIAIRAGGGAVLADAAALRQAGVVLGEVPVRDGLVDLGRLPGFVARYDEELQRLLLDVPAGRLPTQTLARAAAQRAEALADTGFLLGYDAFVRRTGKATLASLWTEQRLFGALGTFSNTGVLRAGKGGGGYLRYDTSLQIVDQDHQTTFSAGDLVTGALSWNGAVRIGGLQIARNFRVRPDLVTMPLPRFQGAAAVPSGVDLLVNGAPAGHHDVAPGPYVLNDLPAVSGAGDVTVVTTDAVGRQVATTARFYVAPELLRPGLSDFSAEAGFLRRRYGQSSLAYGRAVASGTLRHGLTRHLTGEFHAEVTHGLAQAGGGLAWSPGRWGVVQGAVAASRGQELSGRQWVAGYSYLAPRFSLGVQRLDRSAGFRDLASLGFDLARTSGAVRSDRLWGSTALGTFGSLGAAYVSADTADGTRVRLLSATWSGTVGRRLSAFATLGHDARSGGLSGQVRLLVPLGRSSVAAGIGTEPDRGWTTRASYARARTSDGDSGFGGPALAGVGLAADAAIDGRGRAWGQANASWQLPSLRTEMGAAYTPGGTAFWAGASGAVIAMAGDVFRTPAVPGAFAVVSTGVPNVPVRYENQAVGVTGRSGTLLVAAAAAYQPGRYAIDTLDLPAGMTAARVEVEAALRAGAGAVIRLPVRAGRSAVAALVDGAGRPLEPGDAAELPDGRLLPVGWGGELMLEDAAAEQSVTVRRRGGGTCRADVRVPLGPAFQRLEAVACR